MKSSDSSFWAGLGAGSVIGAVIYRIARTNRARRLEKKVGDALGRAARTTGHALADVERKVLHVGSKVAGTSASLTDKVAAKADYIAAKADRMAGKADNVKNKWETMEAKACHK